MDEREPSHKKDACVTSGVEFESEIVRSLPAAPSVIPTEVAVHSHSLEVATITQSAMSALGLCIFVVDPKLRVLYASEASRIHASRPRAGFFVAQRGRSGGTYLSLANGADTIELRTRVTTAITAGSMVESSRTLSQFHPLCSPQIICLIWPMTDGMVDPLMGMRFHDAALLVFKPLVAIPKPPPMLLRSLFGFTQAEAEVASDLVGGITADEVARIRNVRLDTIRSQIKSILSKSGTPNLRAFESRIGSVVAMLPHEANVLSEH